MTNDAAETMTMAEWTTVRNSLWKIIRQKSSIGEKAAIDVAETLLAEGWVSPSAVRQWQDDKDAADEARRQEEVQARATAYANRPSLRIETGQ